MIEDHKLTRVLNECLAKHWVVRLVLAHKLPLINNQKFENNKQLTVSHRETE